MIKYINNIFTAKSIQEGLRPISIIATLSGIKPFNYIPSKTPKSTIHFPKMIYLIGVHCIYFYCVHIILFQCDFQDDQSNTTTILSYPLSIKVILGGICLTLLAVESFFNINRYAVNWYNLEKVDTMMIELGIEINYTALLKESLFVVVTMEFINIVFQFIIALFVSDKLFKPSWKIGVALYGPGYISEMYLLFYGMCAYLVKVNIDRINQQLAKLCDYKLVRGMGHTYQKSRDEDNNGELKNHGTMIKYPIKITKYTAKAKEETNTVMKNMARARKINTIFQIYDKICDITDGMYNAYSFKILVIVTYCFISLVLNLFYVMGVVTSIYLGKYSDVLMSLFFMSLHQGLMNVLFVMFVTTMCEQCRLRVIKLKKIYI